MDQRLSAFVSDLASTVAAAWTSLMDLLRTPIAGGAMTYRPEKYYMRGPGPQWRAKHPQGSSRR
jgi:hypothetical protein